MGLNQSTHGTWNTNAICNLHLATGAICKPGSGPFSLTGQPNAMGGREMGYMGPGLPGQRSVASAADREFVEEQWGIPHGSLRTDVGGGTIDMFSRMADGEIKACWIICTNPVATRGQPEDSDGGSGKRRTGHHPGRVLRDRDQRVRRRVAARRAVDRVRRRDGQLRAQPDAVPAGRRPAGSGDAGLADHRPDRLRDGLFGVVQLRLRRGSIRGDQAVLEPGDGLRPAWRQLPAAAPDPGAVALPARQRRRPQPDPLPATTVSVRTQLVREDGTSRGWRSPPQVAVRCSSPARTCRPRKCPTTTTPSCSTPGACRTSGTR